MLFTVIPASISTGGSGSNALEMEWDREEWQLLVAGCGNGIAKEQLLAQMRRNRVESMSGCVPVGSTVYADSYQNL